jgi:hypothetical protein
MIVILGIYISRLFVSKPKLPDINKLYQYCVSHNYSTDYCILVDFSKPTGINRFFIYDFSKKKIVEKSLCAQGFGKNWNIFKHSKFSNVSGSNYSSLGKYKVGSLRKMSKAFFGKGYTVYGLDSSNSNALARGILIHRGNPGFQTYPLPCIPVSKGCFAVSDKMMYSIETYKQNTNKPILLYAYK